MGCSNRSGRDLHAPNRPALQLSLPLGVAAHAADLTVDGTTVTLNGSLTYDNVRVINGGVITVTDYTGSGTTGTLSITAETITVDSSSALSADGAGSRGVLNGNGEGPGGGRPSRFGRRRRPQRPGGRSKDDSCSQNQGAGGSAYGSSTSTTDMGSAGGAAGSADGDSGGRGAAGGGAIGRPDHHHRRHHSHQRRRRHQQRRRGGGGGRHRPPGGRAGLHGLPHRERRQQGATDDAGGGGGGGVINQFYDASGTTCTATVSAGTSLCETPRVRAAGAAGSTGTTATPRRTATATPTTPASSPAPPSTATGSTTTRGTTDESDAVDAVTYYVDGDGDGYGSVTDAGADACNAPSGSVADNTVTTPSPRSTRARPRSAMGSTTTAWPDGRRRRGRRVDLVPGRR